MSGATFLRKCCCDGVPCSDCTGDQGQVVVSITGTCTDGTGECAFAGDTYDWGLLTQNPGDCTGCLWQWAVTGQVVSVVYDTVLDKWYAQVASFGAFYGATFPGEACVDGRLKEISPLTCSAGGLLSGSFSLPGLAVGPNDCVGCTANVTI